MWVIILQQLLMDFIFSAKWKVYFFFVQSYWAALPSGHTDTGVCIPVLGQEYTWHHPSTPRWSPPSLLGCIPEDQWAGFSCPSLLRCQKAFLSHGSHLIHPQALWWEFSSPAPPAPHIRISEKANYTGFRVNMFVFIFQALLSYL